jgi:hypothetical protein
MMLIAEIIVYGAFAYLAAGAVFALWFVVRGIDRFDPSARGAGIFFRAIVFCGTVPLWAIVLVKLGRGDGDTTNS